jgi:DNA-3-methyladenine glycosylase II
VSGTPDVILDTGGPLDETRLRAALAALAAIDADIAEALDRYGYPAPRCREPGFATLIHIVAAQQVSTASAAAISRKLAVTLDGAVTPEALLGLDDVAMRAAGFSGPKITYARGLAEALVNRDLDLAVLPHLEEEAAVASLTRLKGFGRWSAEIYLLFAHGRGDVFPADDLAVQIAFQRLKRLDARPTAKALRLLVEPWRPYRGAAAVFLWHLYGAATLDGPR